MLHLRPETPVEPPKPPIDNGGEGESKGTDLVEEKTNKTEKKVSRFD